MDPIDKVYANEGNQALLELVVDPVSTVLDVGCGDGANAKLLKSKTPNAVVDGITLSKGEAVQAQRFARHVWVRDVEVEAFTGLVSEEYDLVIFSHVLEHLRFPATLVRDSLRVLKPGGTVLIAVPNALNWRQRMDFLRGRFEYEEFGVMDATHLRFFTFHTADRYLLGGIDEVELVAKRVTGSVPLWLLRRYIFPAQLSVLLDEIGTRRWPNVFGQQVLLKAVKRAA